MTFAKNTSWITIFVVGLTILTSANAEVTIQQNVQQFPTSSNLAPASFQAIVPRSQKKAINEVYGGEPTENEKVVGILLRKKNGTKGMCSGLWISRNIVLTAGHCLCDGTEPIRTAPLVTNISRAQSGKNGDWVEATGMVKFPGYKCSMRGNGAKDLGLVFLARAGLGYVQIAQTNRITALKPRLSLQIKNGDKVCEKYSLFSVIPDLKSMLKTPQSKLWVAGYGYYGDENYEVGERREVSLLINSLTCTQGYARWLGCQPFSEFILGAGKQDVGRRDSCSGDSGGPVFIKKSSGKISPVGIVSRGIPLRGPFRNGVCGAGGIYTHIGLPIVKAWLEKHTVPAQSNQRCS